MIVGGYDTHAKPLKVMSRAAKAANAWGSRTLANLDVYDTRLEGLAQDLQDMTAKLGAFIPEAHAVVGPRYLARHRRWCGAGPETGGW
jgi:hypothetical protein